MSNFLFDAVLYGIAVIGVLTVYGSTFPRTASAPVPTVEPIAPSPAPFQDIELEDFAAVCCPDSPAGLDEVLSFIDELVAPTAPHQMEDVIVPSTRKPRQCGDGLESLGIRQLRAIASQLRISKYSRRSKRELIALIREARQAA